jgi:hypothetical protein
MPEILALEKLRQEDHKVEASLGYIARTCLKRKLKHINKQISKQTSTRLIFGMDSTGYAAHAELSPICILTPDLPKATLVAQM